MGAIFVVALIFFASFLGYIAFNPKQAHFFITFGINPADVKVVLQRLVNGIFGTITFIMAIFWFVYLLRAVRTSISLRKKKTIATILAIFLGITLFSTITFWIFLVTKINASDFENPDGGIVISDNAELLSSKFTKETAKMDSFDNLIGPITLKFDLASNARIVENQMKITHYTIDFDGDNKPDKEGSNPKTDDSIIYIFDKKMTYSPKVTYIGTDKITGEDKTIVVAIPDITVVGLVTVKETKQRLGGVRASFDAQDLKSLGQIEWYPDDSTEKGALHFPNTPDSKDYQYFPDKTFKGEGIICLSLVSNQSDSHTCNRVFVVNANQDAGITGSITAKQDADDPFSYTFSVGYINKPKGSATYEWMADQSIMPEKTDTAQYKFSTYGSHTVSVHIKDEAGNTLTLSSDLNVKKPLHLLVSSDMHLSALKVRNKKTNEVVPLKYDRDRNVYLLPPTLAAPITLELDGRDITVVDPGYRLTGIDWDTTSTGAGSPDTYDKRGMVVPVDIFDSSRYIFVARYEFTSTKDATDKEYLNETVILDSREKSFTANMKITQNSEYAPARVRVDASSSNTTSGRIAKFVFNFGEKGHQDAEGDAVQEYQYSFPGEYDVTVTAVKDTGEKVSTTQKLILKERGRSVMINTSVSSGFTGKPIDFDAGGTTGQVDSYMWKFGDGGVSSAPTPSYTYKKSGKYSVTLTVTYKDGTSKTGSKDITVQSLGDE